MNTRIIAMYPCKGKFCTVEIFGYSTRGLPGLEIVGLGGSGRQLKEKLIYITRLQKVGLPLNRYVLCVEKKGRIVAEDSMWMELPLLILLWKLGGVLPINRLENCFAGGILDLEGNVRELQLSEDYLHTFDQRLTKRGISLNYIGRNKKAKFNNLNILDVHELLASARPR